MSRLSRSIVAVAASVSLLVTGFATTSTAAPKTTQGNAYALVKNYLNEYNGSAFSKAVQNADLTKYREALANVNVVVDRGLTEIAVFEPSNNTITLSMDPGRVSKKNRLSVGQTIWHELTHAIEFANGDFSAPNSGNTAYDERNVEYMTHVHDVAFNTLRLMERAAKRGASVAKLRTYWEKFQGEMAEANALSTSTAQFPTDPGTLNGWFGFQASPTQIEQFYLSGKFLPGARGKNLREAIDPSLATGPSWKGTWIVARGESPNFGKKPAYSYSYSITQTGNQVTITDICNSSWTGTVTGRELTGAAQCPGNPGAGITPQSGMFVFTIAANGKSFTGYQTIDPGSTFYPNGVTLYWKAKKVKN